MVGNCQRKNFKYMLMDNESHESIGDQPILLKNLNTKKIIRIYGVQKPFFMLTH